MKTYLHLLGAVAAGALLSACGDNGDGDNLYSSYGAMNSDAQAMAAKYDIVADVSDYVDLPPGGTATYQGFVGGELDVADPDNDEFIGQLTLTADFAADDVTDGRAYNFLREDSTDIAGELTLANGGIFDNGGIAEITANLDGDLDGVASAIALDGVFLQGDQAVAGIAAGSVAGDDILSGGFIAER